jgi:hypothetical protein
VDFQLFRRQNPRITSSDLSEEHAENPTISEALSSKQTKREAKRMRALRFSTHSGVEVPMEKKYVATLLAIWLGFLVWLGITKADGPLFDVTKTRQEMEIMKGILNSTMRIALRELNSGTAKTETTRIWHSPEADISSYYLYGQGAVFKISMSGQNWMVTPRIVGKPFAVPRPPKPPKAPLPPAPPLAPPAPSSPLIQEEGDPAEAPDIDVEKVTREAMEQAKKGMAQAKKEMAQAKKEMDVANLLSQEEQLKMEKEIKASLVEAQKSLKEWRLQVEKSREELAKQMAQMKPYLVEALAKHADSITVVKPQEYITLMLSLGGNRWVVIGGEEEEEADTEILSVQKSTILDYKAGRISMEDFKKKVFSYIQ